MCSGARSSSAKGNLATCGFCLLVINFKEQRLIALNDEGAVSHYCSRPGCTYRIHVNARCRLPNCTRDARKDERRIRPWLWSKKALMAPPSVAAPTPNGRPRHGSALSAYPTQTGTCWFGRGQNLRSRSRGHARQFTRTTIATPAGSSNSLRLNAEVNATTKMSSTPGWSLRAGSGERCTGRLNGTDSPSAPTTVGMCPALPPGSSTPLPGPCRDDRRANLVSPRRAACGSDSNCAMTDSSSGNPGRCCPHPHTAMSTSGVIDHVFQRLRQRCGAAGVQLSDEVRRTQAAARARAALSAVTRYTLRHQSTQHLPPGSTVDTGRDLVGPANQGQVRLCHEFLGNGQQNRRRRQN